MELTEQQKDEIINMIGNAISEEVEDGDLHLINVYEMALEFCTLLTGVNFLAEISFHIWRTTHRDAADKLIAAAKIKGVTIKTHVIDLIVENFIKIIGIKYPPINDK